MAPSDAVPAGPRSRSFVWPILRWLAASVAVAALGAMLVLPRVIGTPERVTRLAATALPELLADVKPARVQLGWFGPIVLEDVQIVPRNGDKTPLAIRRIEVSHGLGGILMTLGDLGRVRVEGLEADIAFDREHRSNIDAILPPDEADAGVVGSGPRRAVVRVRLEIEDAVVKISGPWTADPWVSDPIDVRATLANGADGYAEWTVEPVQLLTQAELEQPVAHEVLAYIVPVFADAARTSGRFSLRLDGGRFPVGRPEQAELAGVLGLHEVVLGPGPLVQNMFQSLPMKLPPPPTIRVADESHVEFHLAERRMWHKGLEFGVPLKKPGQRLDVRSEGSVGLADRSLNLKLSLPIPADLPQDRPLVAALAGKQISLGVGGVLGEPQVIFDGSIKAAAGQVLVDFIDRLRDGPQPQLPVEAAQQPAAVPPPPRPAWAPPGPFPTTSGTAADGQAQADAPTAMPVEPDDADAPVVNRDKAAQAVGDAARKAGADPNTTDAIVDLVGGVLGEVAKRRAERRASEAANPDQVQPPPRRGRLLQRRGLPPAATPAP